MKQSEYDLLLNQQKRRLWLDATGAVPKSAIWKNYPPKMTSEVEKIFDLRVYYQYLGGL